VPASTYRVQISTDFDLPAAAGLADYLAALGVTHLYSSPLLSATTGSGHGYDVVDHSRVDPRRGGEDGRRALVAALREHRLGLVVDLVPNHVGVQAAAENPAWWDLLRLGPQSVYARWFDVDWSRGRLLLPLLADGADPLADLRVENGELRYFDLRFPLAAGTERLSAQEAHRWQHYELVPWRRGDAELNYRRFFAISSLAAVRVEDPVVFAATHAEPLRWLAAGDVDGLRVDHPDGLADPTGYLRDLRAAADAAAGRPVWLVVEKILEPGEELPADWSVDGTTGYDALADVDGVLVDPAGEAAFTALDESLTGVRTSWPDLVHDCKLEVTSGMLGAEVRRLEALVPEIPDAGAALAEVLACFPVYRSYLPTGREHLQAALAEAKRRRPERAEVLAVLGPRLAEPADPLAVRFEQTSGAVMAKGVEDTAYYRWTRFVALNEVGGDPTRFGRPPAEFHAALARRQRRWPAGMTTLSTHDTKRSEDVRARLCVLAEIPDEWSAAVARWGQLAPPPDGAVGHLLWQTVVGAWPLSRRRLHEFAEKAMREARTHTSWSDPNAVFETEMHAVVDAVYDLPALRTDVEAIAGRIERYGWSNSLSQKLLQLTMPGVPDVYQGCELWDDSLVDPDNRRPVDFETRRAMLARLDEGPPPGLDETGAAKLLVVSRALRLRRDRPEAFASYTPLLATGPAADHVVAFDRGGAVTVATRLPVRLDRHGGWRDTDLRLPPGDWVDVLTGTHHRAGPPLRLSDLLARYPVALLRPDQAASRPSPRVADMGQARPAG
jgi:(1->4)-alpha-D-glucan 1-alpha-D-glucosylmutase